MKYDLTDFDNRLMNGLVFCKKVYDLFAHIRSTRDGIKRLRLRKGETEKKLIEELMPIARYIQARYSHGRQLKVRWINGGQQYDARLLSVGPLVDRRLALKRQHLEVTTAVHENDHLVRRIIDDKGHAFTAKGMVVDRKAKQVTSTPYVYSNDEAQDDLASRLIDRIKAKNTISYPTGTVLVIQCFLDTPFLEDEWDDAIQRVKSQGVKHRFREVFIFDSNYHYSATIHESRRQKAR
jgi:hypothetical protein